MQTLLLGTTLQLKEEKMSFMCNRSTLNSWTLCHTSKHRRHSVDDLQIKNYKQKQKKTN